MASDKESDPPNRSTILRTNTKMEQIYAILELYFYAENYFALVLNRAAQFF